MSGIKKKAGHGKKSVLRHFRRHDPAIHDVLARAEWEMLRPTEKSSGYFNRLCREIISQQLGSGAARAIVARFRLLFPRGRATPGRVLSLPEERLRATGMSWAKARSLRDLAARAAGREIDFGKFAAADDEEVVAALVKVKGIGRWTAEMFLMFRLQRPDVLPVGDLGIVKAVQRAYRLRSVPSAKRLIRLGESWRPYRSVACWYLWASLE